MSYLVPIAPNGSAPKIVAVRPDVRTGKVYSSIVFTTYTLPCFTELYNSFYIEGKKVIHLNIEDLLTPLVYSPQ